MDDLFDSRDSGAIDLARRLEAFAEARLTPSVASTTALRGAVMAAAHRRAALVATEAGAQAAMSVATIVTDVPVRPSHGHASWRRPLVALLAGGLTLGVLAGTAFASQPGGLLYEVRVWSEMAALPAGGVDRARAEVNRLDDRLAEASRASAAGDEPALEAALAAYAAIVAEAGAGSAGDPAANAVIEAAVVRHVEVLTALLLKVPLPARAAIQLALDSSTKVLNDIDRATPSGTDGNGGTGGNSGTGGSGGNSGTGGGGGRGTPGGQPADPAATPTAKPPKPTPPGHDRTPKPQATDHREPNGPGIRSNPDSSARP